MLAETFKTRWTTALTVDYCGTQLHTVAHAGKKIPARESFLLGNQFLHWRSIARVLAETLKTRWTTAFTVDYCGTQLHTVAHASKINPARESLPLGNQFLHWHSIARVLAQTLNTRWTTAFTVDYCGTQLHTVAHASKRIPARESISSLTCCRTHVNARHEHSSQTWISELRAATPHNYSSTTLYYKVLLQYYSVLQSTTPVLLCTTKYYSSTTLYYTVLLQYYSVLQSTTPVLLCTTKYYSSTTLYYKVLIQYYSVLQSTTPVLLCTTTYYSSTTLYYKVLLQYYTVLLQYYSVLQSTTPVLLCTTKYYSSTTLYYTVLLQYYSSTTLYYNVLLQYYSVLQSTTPVLLCTTKYYSSTQMKRYLQCAGQHAS